jgi:hypothetical protein
MASGPVSGQLPASVFLRGDLLQIPVISAT